jgi:UDP-glucose 4-epimerase
MKILVIGSKGFIGNHIYNYFNRAQEFETWSCDIVVDYTSERYIQVDATNADFTEIFAKQSFTICINCSGAASVPDSITNPQRDFSLNTYNVFRILDAIRKYSPSCKFINMSSAAVYGNPTQLPVNESAPTQPVSPYGLHKLMAEKICQEFSQYYKVPTCSVRIFSAYGSQLKKQIIWDLYQKSKQSDTVEMWGTGAESRDFIHVSDIVKAIDLIIEQASFSGECINIANGVETTIRELVELWVGITNWQGKVVFTGKTRIGDPVRWKADISIIQSFGYQASITLRDGIENYYKWARENT